MFLARRRCSLRPILIRHVVQVIRGASVELALLLRLTTKYAVQKSLLLGLGADGHLGFFFVGDHLPLSQVIVICYALAAERFAQFHELFFEPLVPAMEWSSVRSHLLE